MANPLPRVARASDDLIWDAALSMSNEDPDFPVENLQTDNPAKLAKSTTNTTTITITTVSATPVAVALIQTNAETATFEGQSVAIPSLDLDGQRIHPWLVPVGLSAATSRQLVLSRASGPVWIGRVAMVTALEPLNLKYGLKFGRLRPGDISVTTRLGSENKVGAQIRRRWAAGAVDTIESETMLEQLEASGKGALLPFLFIPDELKNDAWFVRFRANDFEKGFSDYDVRPIPLTFDEVSSGPPNG